MHLTNFAIHSIHFCNTFILASLILLKIFPGEGKIFGYFFLIFPCIYESLAYKCVRYVATCEENPAFLQVCGFTGGKEYYYTHVRIRAHTFVVLSATRVTIHVAKLLITNGEMGLCVSIGKVPRWNR